MPSQPRLITTGQAARALGIDQSTLHRWHAAGHVKPNSRTVGGHLRWDLDELREQIRALQASEEQ